MKKSHHTMNHPISRGRFLAAGAGLAALGLPSAARAERFHRRYEFACEQSSGFSFLVDAPVTNLQPHPSIADRVRSGALRQRERVEFPYAEGDIMRSLVYYEDPAKPFSAANAVPGEDPRILIEFFTDVTSFRVKRTPFPHFLVMGMVIGNPSGTFFGDLTWRVVTFSAAIEPAGTPATQNFRLVVSSTASSHVLGARTGAGILTIKPGEDQ